MRWVHGLAVALSASGAAEAAGTADRCTFDGGPAPDFSGSDWAETGAGASCAAPLRVLRFVRAGDGALVRSSDASDIAIERYDAVARAGDDLILTYIGPAVQVIQVYRLVAPDRLRLWTWEESDLPDGAGPGGPTISYVAEGVRRIGDDGEQLATGQPTPEMERCAAPVMLFGAAEAAFLGGGLWVAQEGGGAAPCGPGRFTLRFTLEAPLAQVVVEGAPLEDLHVTRITRAAARLQLIISGQFDATIEEFKVLGPDRMRLWSSLSPLVGGPAAEGRLTGEGKAGETPELVKCKGL